MTNYLKKMNDNILKLEENVTYIFLLIVVLLVFIAALLRTAGVPQAWMNDLAKLLFGWVVFIGSDIALAQNKHIGVEFVEEKLPVKTRKFISILWSSLMILFLVFSIRYGWLLVTKNRREFNSLTISQSGIAIFIILFIGSYIYLHYFHHNTKKNKYKIIILMAITAILAGLAYYLLPHDRHPLSYAFLIAAVPIGCILMVRTELINIFKKWSAQYE